MINSIIKHGISVLFAVLLLSACNQGHNQAQHPVGDECENIADKQPLSIQHGWVRAPQKGQKITAAYFTICNQAESEDRLISVSTLKANAAELHETKNLEGGRVSMQPVATLIIPARGSVALAPGGYHIMLIDLASDVSTNEDIKIELTFENAGSMTTLLPIKQRIREQTHQDH